MRLPEGFSLFVMSPPDLASAAGQHGLPVAHMAYRVGGGGHLFCAQRPFLHQGGLMVLDCRGFDGKGSPEALCREIFQECAARKFSGVFCDFEGDVHPFLVRMLHALASLFQKQGWQLYLTEAYGEPGPAAARVVIPTALSGGSLQGRLEEAVSRFGAQRVAMGLERVMEDFTLPAERGEGRSMAREELARLFKERSPSVYFSTELCAHYFTYMPRGESAHFILFDDASSINKKLRVGAALGISQGFLPYAQTSELLPQILE